VDLAWLPAIFFVSAALRNSTPEQEWVAACSNGKSTSIATTSHYTDYLHGCCYGSALAMSGSCALGSLVALSLGCANC